MADSSTVATIPPRAARWYLPLRLRLGVLVVVGVLPLLCFSLVDEYFNYRATVERTGRESLAKAQTLTEAIDAELRARINVLQVLATSNRLRAGDIAGFRARVEVVIAQEYPGANVVLLDENGRQQMNLAVPAGEKLPVRPYVETIRKVYATGKPAVSDLYFGAALQRLVISIDVPVLDEKGTVLSVLSMVPAAGSFDHLIRRHSPGGESIAAIFDGQYAMLTRSRDPERHVGQKMRDGLRVRMQRDAEGIEAEGTSREGIPVLVVFSRSQTFGWSVVVGVPRAELTGPALASAAQTLSFSGMLLLVGLLLASLVARSISGPIAALHRIASASASNDVLPTAATGLRETDQVAQALRVAQDRQRRSEQRFRTLFEANPLAMCVYDLVSLRVLAANEAMSALYGWSRAEIEAMTLTDLWPPEERARLSERVERRGRGTFTLKQWRKDGSRFDAEAVVRIIELDGRRVAMSACQDITQRKAIESQLRQSQKMETFGQIAGGVAHDLNNSLAVVMGCLEDILDSADRDAVAAADTAMHATQQAAALTGRLLAFSRRQELAPVELDVGAVVGDLHKILRSAVPPAIELTIEAAAGAARTVLDRSQLEAAVMNLVVNARDAIEDSGDGHGAIAIAVGARDVSEQEAIEQPELRPGRWIVVSVRDDGHGMSEAVRTRIFEPFFTTKEVGRGTGLGLSQIHGFVLQSGGFITVESTVGKGTRMALHFPARADRPGT